MRDLVHSPALTSYGAHLIDMRYVTRSRLASDHSPDSDDYMNELIKYGCSPGAHPAGTCKMGGKDDETAVVDPELRYACCYYMHYSQQGFTVEIPELATAQEPILKWICTCGSPFEQSVPPFNDFVQKLS